MEEKETPTTSKFITTLKKVPVWRMAGGLIILVAIGVFLSGLGSWVQAIPSPAGILDVLFPGREVPSANESLNTAPYEPELGLERSVIDVVKRNADAVVSVIQTKDVPIFETCYRQQSPFGDLFQDPLLREFFGDDFQVQIPERCRTGTEQREVGGGTGFIISSEGLIVTNKHVVADQTSAYSVFTNSGERHDAEVLARDPFQDFAILKINASNLTTVMLGNSDGIEIGQFVVAIGNALGEFRNTVSIGVVSGVRRNISASGPGGFQETLEEVIQTDAAINPGNSGGPLLNLKGEVIGINTALAQGAQNIGFTIPINGVKRSIASFQSTGRIVYPFLGVRYAIVTSALQKERGLPLDYGALVSAPEQGALAVVQNSAADKAGIREGDIILELNNTRITADTPLAKLVLQYQPGAVVKLKILRANEELLVDVTLGEQTS